MLHRAPMAPPELHTQPVGRVILFVPFSHAAHRLTVLGISRCSVSVLGVGDVVVYHFEMGRNISKSLPSCTESLDL